ncbi:hypothetical protein [Actinacidiphila glaucinigra]|uniref:hypothetical protein n=1 Tax=Actinacidiphila glaucinigra TaxID=235986 RepID=UPI0035E0EC1B
MFYLGVIYANAYYSYFHVSIFALGLGFGELVIHSLGLIRAPVVIICVLAVLLSARGSTLLPPTLLPRKFAAAAGRAAGVVARAHVWIVLAGVGLVIAWQAIQPFRWLAPVTIAAGFIIGQSRAANRGRRPQGLRDRAVPTFVAGVFLLWAATLVAGQLGVQDAQTNARNLLSRTAVVLYSTERISIRGPSVQVVDLGKEVRFRYRYTGLRQLVERGGRFYLLPVGWDRRVDAIYLIQQSDTIRVELMPGTQPG